MKAAIILKDADLTNFNEEEFDIVIGADKGALWAIQNGINPDISIGDFDSVNDKELNKIEESSGRIIKLNPIKDASDTHEAIELVKDFDEIYLLGGIQGKRIEHLFANVIDLMNYPNVKMMDANSLFETADSKTDYEFNKNYKFVSFYALEDNTILSLDGFKYNLYSYSLKRNNALCLSNEIIGEPKLNLQSGRLLIIYSKGD